MCYKIISLENMLSKPIQVQEDECCMTAWFHLEEVPAESNS